jgi:hypothetical protein
LLLPEMLGFSHMPSLSFKAGALIGLSVARTVAASMHDYGHQCASPGRKESEIGPVLERILPASSSIAYSGRCL